MAADDIGLDTIITLTGEFPEANLDDDLVILNPETARYHVLHGVGGPIFRLLDRPRSVREICDALTERFDVPADVCQREVLEFLRKMASEGLIATR